MRKISVLFSVLFIFGCAHSATTLPAAPAVIEPASDKEISVDPCEEAVGVGGSVSNCLASVTVAAFQAPPDSGINTGSGVVIFKKDEHNGYVLTAAHIFSEKFVKILVLHRTTKGTGVTSPATLIAIDPEMDLALLRIVSPLASGFPVTVKLGSLSGLQPGSRVYSIGSPGLREFNALVIGDFVQQTRNKEFKKWRALLMNLAIVPGVSGGGVFDKSGKLIGIAKGIFGADGHPWPPLSYVVSVEQVRLFLEKNHACLEDSKKACPDDPIFLTPPTPSSVEEDKTSDDPGVHKP